MTYPEKTDKYNIDIFNDNFREIDEKKVDKSEGMGLSANNYTTEEKEKLSQLENYNDTELKSQIVAIHNIPALTKDTYSSLFDWANSLPKGETQAFISKNSDISNVPVNDNIVIKIYTFSQNTAYILVFPTGTLYCNRIYIISKVSGEWKKWYTFTGTEAEV